MKRGRQGCVCTSEAACGAGRTRQARLRGPEGAQLFRSGEALCTACAAAVAAMTAGGRAAGGAHAHRRAASCATASQPSFLLHKSLEQQVPLAAAPEADCRQVLRQVPFPHTSCPALRIFLSPPVTLKRKVAVAYIIRRAGTGHSKSWAGENFLGPAGARDAVWRMQNLGEPSASRKLPKPDWRAPNQRAGGIQRVVGPGFWAGGQSAAEGGLNSPRE